MPARSTVRRDTVRDTVRDTARHLSRFVVCLGLLLGAWSPRAATAVELNLLTPATTTLPFDILAIGSVPNARIPGEITIEVDGLTVRMLLEIDETSAGSIGLAEVVEVPRLDEPGDYVIELVAVDRATGARTQVGSTAVEVLEGIDIEIDAATIGVEPVRLAFVGETSPGRACAGLRPEAPIVGDQTIVAVLDFACNILPEPPGPFRLETEIDAFTLDLLPGTWRIDAVDTEGRLLGRRTVELRDQLPRLQNRRFAVLVDWFDFDGRTGVGASATQPSDDSALLSFFDPANWELMVKVLDGCAINGHYWVFGAAATNVQYDLVVVDIETFDTFEYLNPLGEFSPAFADIEAFPCD